MHTEALIVGGGIAGLTAAAYLSRAGCSTLLLEKQSSCGGLVNSFEREGFHYDGGIRAMENSGILFPMLNELDLDINFIKNNITLGIGDRVIHIQSEDDLILYQSLLEHFFPENQQDIQKITAEIKKIMYYMEVQYGIDNPVFLDLARNRGYLLKKILPWMIKYALTYPRISALNQPVEEFLKKYTASQALIDIISQHFFTNTPTFFALSYLKIYLDYHYPAGGTATLIHALLENIQNHQGVIKNGVEVQSVNPGDRCVVDQFGNQYPYQYLVWAADQNALYNSLEIDQVQDTRTKNNLLKRKDLITDKIGNDSVLTLYLAVDKDPSYFREIASEHFFYTAEVQGESEAGPIPLNQDRNSVEAWLKDFLRLTTYEISIPVLRDPTLAPPGKTALIISVLFDYHLTKYISEMGWYKEFKALAEQHMLATLAGTIYPGIDQSVIHQFSSTPLTIEKATGNTHGAITGWSFQNDPIPAVYRLPQIFKSIKTPLNNILQAGQWTYSPSGLPISILTGKLAADRVIKLRK